MRLVDEEHPQDGGMTALGDSKTLSRLAATRGGAGKRTVPVRSRGNGTERDATERKATRATTPKSAVHHTPTLGVSTSCAAAARTSSCRNDHWRRAYRGLLIFSRGCSYNSYHPYRCQRG